MKKEKREKKNEQGKRKENEEKKETKATFSVDISETAVVAMLFLFILHLVRATRDFITRANCTKALPFLCRGDRPTAFRNRRGRHSFSRDAVHPIATIVHQVRVLQHKTCAIEYSRVRAPATDDEPPATRRKIEGRWSLTRIMCTPAERR